MQHGNLSTNQVGTPNDYTYNGKEMNSDFGLNLSDYGARWYDASLGRWHSVDPHADSYTSWSPYSYVFNNPLGFTDPDGRDPDPAIKKLNTVTGRLDFYFDRLYSETVHGTSKTSKETGASFISGTMEIMGNEYNYIRGTTENVTRRSNGVMRFQSPNLREGETHLLDYHSHANESDHKTNSEQKGTPPSPEDILNMKTSMSIVETDEKRYGLVVTDEKAYKEFSSDANFEKHVEGMESAIGGALVKAWGEHQKSGGTIDNFNAQAIKEKAMSTYLSENNAGVGLYQTTNSEKTEYEEIK